MRQKTAILARNRQEAKRVADALEVGRFTYVTSPLSVKSLRSGVCLLVEGWQTRADRHAIKSAMRWTRGVTYIDVDPSHAEEDLEPIQADFTQFFQEPRPDFTDFLAVQPEGAETIGYMGEEGVHIVEPEPAPEPTPDPFAELAEGKRRFEAAVEEMERKKKLHERMRELGVTPPTDEVIETQIEPKSAPESAPEQKKPGRRRSRCKSCGNLHYKEDPCPEDGE